MNPIENIWNIMKKEIGNQMLCKKRMKRVCEAWYIVFHQTSLKNFTIQCQGEMQILLKQMEH